MCDPTHLDASVEGQRGNHREPGNHEIPSESHFCWGILTFAVLLLKWTVMF